MDSPAFGSSNKNPKMFKATTNHSQMTMDQKHAQNTLIMLIVQKNIRKMISVLNTVQLKKKRACFLQIKYKQTPLLMSNDRLNSNEYALILQVQRKLGTIVSVIQRGILRNKVSTWKQIVSFNILKMYNQQKRLRTFNNDQKQQIRATSQRVTKRGQDWKQNSSSNGIDLAAQNKKLKGQLNKQQLQQQSFINKMKSLLDAHQKQKPKIQSKKKK